MLTEYTLLIFYIVVTRPEAQSLGTNIPPVRETTSTCAKEIKNTSSKENVSSLKESNTSSSSKENSSVSSNLNSSRISKEKESSGIYAVPIVHKKKKDTKNKFAGCEFPIASEEQSSKEAIVDSVEQNEGYSIPVTQKKRAKSEKSPSKKISIKDRRETDAGYENPLPDGKSNCKLKASVSDEKNIQTNSSVHYAVSEGKSVTLPPISRHQPQYHVLENGPSPIGPLLPTGPLSPTGPVSPTGPLSPTSPPQTLIGKPASAKNHDNHKYSTLEPPINKTVKKITRDSTRSGEPPSHMYHTLEQPTPKQAKAGCVGSGRSFSANNSNATLPQAIYQGDEYAIPFDQIRKDSKNKHAGPVYHVLEKPK